MQRTYIDYLRALVLYALPTLVLDANSDGLKTMRVLCKFIAIFEPEFF